MGSEMCIRDRVTAASPFSAHVRGHTIGVTIDRGVFFCLLLVCVSAVVYHTYCSPFSAHVRGHTIGVTIDRSVFFASSCVTTSKLRLSHNICHRKRGVRGVLVMPCYGHCQVASVVCYAVLRHGRVRACNVCIQWVPWYVVVRPGYNLLSRLPN